VLKELCNVLTLQLLGCFREGLLLHFSVTDSDSLVFFQCIFVPEELLFIGILCSCFTSMERTNLPRICSGSCELHVVIFHEHLHHLQVMRAQNSKIAKLHSIGILLHFNNVQKEGKISARFQILQSIYYTKL
jgi:hypothetical protein